MSDDTSGFCYGSGDGAGYGTGTGTGGGKGAGCANWNGIYYGNNKGMSGHSGGIVDVHDTIDEPCNEYNSTNIQHAMITEGESYVSRCDLLFFSYREWKGGVDNVDGINIDNVKDVNCMACLAEDAACVL